MLDTWAVTSNGSDIDEVLKRGNDAYLQGKWVDAVGAFREVLDRGVKIRLGAPTRAEMKRAKVVQGELKAKLGHCLRMMGRIEDAEEEFEDVRSIAVKLDNNRLLAEAILGLGFVAWRKGDYDLGNERFNKVIEMSEWLHDSVIKGRAYTGLGSIALVLRRLNDGIEAYEKALKLMRGSEDAKQELGRLTHNLAFLYLKQGDLEKSEKIFKRAMRLCDDIGDLHTAGFAYSNLAHLYILDGRTEEASDLLERSGRLLARTNDRIGLNLVGWVRGLYKFKKDDPKGAIAEYRKARKGFEAMGLRTQVFHLTMDYIPVFKAAGMRDELLETLDKIKSNIEEKGFADLMSRLLEEEKALTDHHNDRA